MYHIFIIHLSTAEHLGSSHLLTLLKMNMAAQVSVELGGECVGHIPRSGITGMVGLFFAS